MAWQMVAGAAGLSLASSLLSADIRNKQAGDQAYESRAKYLGTRLRATMRMDAATKNISAARRDKVLTNMAIEMKQAEAEANAKVNAAAAGTEGNSVEDVENQTKVNASNAKAAAERERKNEEAGYIAQIFGASYDASQPFLLPEPPNMLGPALLKAGAAGFNNWSID